MSTIKASWTQLAAQGSVIEVCSNLPGDRLACSSMDGAACYIQIFERDPATGEWDLISQVQAPGTVSRLAWPHPEAGPLLAGGTTSGSVVVWEAPRQHMLSSSGDMDQDTEDQREWRLVAEVHCSKHAVRHLSFGPRQLGLTMLVACKDGGVHVLEADRLLAPVTWTLQSKFQAATALQGSGAECMGLSWRSFSPGAAPLVAVALKGSVDIWQYLTAVMSWQRVATLPASQPGAVMTSVHWAPTLGRPCELVAAAHGTTVDIFSLSGDTSALDVELVASLEHSGPVWKVEFNMLGTCLAAATDTNLVHLWKPDFGGKWLLVSCVAGSPDAGDDEGEDVV